LDATDGRAVTNEWQQVLVPFVELVGARVDEAAEGYSRLSLLLEERHTNPNGVCTEE
jgi:acyl-coenzyme A thioesterase PaaI-like protein